MELQGYHYLVGYYGNFSVSDFHSSFLFGGAVSDGSLLYMVFSVLMGIVGFLRRLGIFGVFVPPVGWLVTLMWLDIWKKRREPRESHLVWECLMLVLRDLRYPPDGCGIHLVRGWGL